MIQFQNVSVSLQNQLILKQLSFELSHHRIAIFGLNGSGKTTLLKTFNGLIAPSSGKICINQYSTVHNIKQIRNEVGLIFQNPESQIIFPTVEEELSFGLKNQKHSPDVIEQKIAEILKQFGWESFRKKSCYELSGGEKKLLTLLSILVMNPNVLVFDEPMSFLDLKRKSEWKHIMQKLEQTMIVATHHLEDVADFEHALVLHEGQLAFEGIPQSAFETYQQLALQ